MQRNEAFKDNEELNEVLPWGMGVKTYSIAQKKFWNEWNIGVIIIHIAFICSIIAWGNVFNLFALKNEVVLNVGLDIGVLVLSSLMYLSCARSVRFDKTTVSFMFLLAVCSLYNYLDAVYWIINGRDNLQVLSIIVNTLYYICPVVMTCIFLHFIYSLVDKTDKYFAMIKRIIYVFAATAILTILVNIYGEYFFRVSESGTYIRNEETYYLSLVIPTVMLIVCTVYILCLKLRWVDRLTLIIYTLLPYISGLLTLFIKDSTLITVLSFCSLFVIYINLFTKRERELVVNQKILSETKINSMMLQINPHFIYNTLGMIGSLCVEDPEKARKLIYTFSDYLRNNISEMSKRPLVPFKKEIEHLKTYIEIEKERFPDIEIVLNLNETDFEIPSLSVQPLLENAITHGIMGKESGGMVTISSYLEKDYYCVCVEDNGVGFENAFKNDGKNHIGIANVLTRLKLLCDGDLIIDSKVGIGTKALIRIRKGDGK